MDCPNLLDTIMFVVHTEKLSGKHKEMNQKATELQHIPQTMSYSSSMVVMTQQSMSVNIASTSKQL